MERIQKELFEACQQTNRHWVDRMQSEIALWAGLGSKLVSTRSVPEAFDTYAKCVSQQMKMTVEDGQHLLSDCQQVTQKIIQPLTQGWWPKGST
jgi:surfactin synthase thioesterase subunit